jgi:uncharacterized spore protein YtfJ
MSNQVNKMVASAVNSWEEGTELVEKLFDVTKPGVIFSEPIQAEGYTVITASEVSIAMGFGYGIGGAADPTPAEGETEEDEPAGGMGGGGGGGGGGGSSGRPVAVITISQDGVQVDEVVDVTKIALALFTALGSMFLMFSKMLKAAKG